MRMKHCRFNPNNTCVADFDNYPRDKPARAPSEYDNGEEEEGKESTKYIRKNIFHNLIANNQLL